MENNIGKFIASLRKEKGLTQAALGEKLYVTDKAVSKWERGLCLPDITLLEKLAQELDVEVVDILNGKKGTTKMVDVEAELEKLSQELKRAQKKKGQRIMLVIVVLVVLIIYILFRNMFLGYEVEKVHYAHTNRDIHVGIPRLSFMIENNDRSYSFKNLRSSNIVENEVKKYLKTLKYSTCNNTIYYYNEKDNFSIISYSIKSHGVYSTISYEIVENDYCYIEKINEYANKLGGLKRFHLLNGGRISLDEEWNSKFEVMFLDGVGKTGNIYNFEARLQVFSYQRKSLKEFYTYTLEDSVGNFSIEGDKLYYYRKDILERSDDIQIPEVSVFQIDKGNLILIDNYLASYSLNIVLK